MSRDGWVVVSSYLRAEEAELLRGLLESADIDVLVEDLAISALNPLLQSAVGGAKLLVPAGDVERAAGIVAASGLFTGGPAGEVEIPEAEWSANPVPGAVRVPPRPALAVAGEGDGAAAERAAGHALRAAFASLALAPTLVLPLYALAASLRCAVGRVPTTRRARRRAAWATAVSAVALVLGLALWGSVLPALRPAAPDRSAPLPARRPFP